MNELNFDVIIKSKNNAFDLHFKELLRYKDLILLFVKRDFVSQYKQTILGPAWAIIQPLLSTIVSSFIFGNIAGLGPEGVPTFIFYLAGTIIWSYFANCLSSTATTFTANSAIMGKVYFPRLAMPISTVLNKLISLGIQFGMFLFFLIFYLITKSNIHCNWFILLVPILILQLAMLALGFGVIISALTTKYRDLVMLVPFLTEIWKYCSPVAYDMFKLTPLAPGGKFYSIYMCNPITPVVNTFRYAFFGIGYIDWTYYIISWITTFVIFFIGIFMFNKVERTFMDTI